LKLTAMFERGSSIVASSADTIGAFNTGFDTGNLLRPTRGSRNVRRHSCSIDVRQRAPKQPTTAAGSGLAVRVERGPSDVFIRHPAAVAKGALAHGALDAVA